MTENVKAPYNYAETQTIEYHCGSELGGQVPLRQRITRSSTTAAESQKVEYHCYAESKSSINAAVS